MYVCICVSMSLYMYVYVSVCHYVCVYECMSALIFVCMCVCMYICMYLYMYLCIYVCMYVCLSVHLPVRMKPAFGVKLLRSYYVTKKCRHKNYVINNNGVFWCSKTITTKVNDTCSWSHTIRQTDRQKSRQKDRQGLLTRSSCQHQNPIHNHSPVVCLVTDLNHLSSNLGVGMSEDCFILHLRLITFGGRPAHLASHVHKSGRKTLFSPWNHEI